MDNCEILEHRYPLLLGEISQRLQTACAPPQSEGLYRNGHVKLQSFCLL